MKITPKYKGVGEISKGKCVKKYLDITKYCGYNNKEHKMFNYLNLYKGLILARNSVKFSHLFYLNLYKGLIHNIKMMPTMIATPTLTYIRD